ncbi:MAG: glycosyltransferase [Elusimicrobiota bacterium]|jgi:glycosyltransferase involved in cell wall biosynthesis
MTQPLKILIVHNAYSVSGGEDACVANEVNALRGTELELQLFQVRSDPGFSGKIAAALSAAGGGFEGRLEDLLRRFRPDIVHAHNLWPLLSPRLFSRAKALGARTCLTMHNYRPLCLNGLFLTPRQEICERCAGGNYWPGIVRGCYRDSRLASAALACHAWLSARRHWYDDVDAFIAPAEFLKNKYIARGWTADRIEIQGHFIPVMPVDPPSPPQPYVLYLGRLSREKGIDWLVDLFRTNPQRRLGLKIAGTGPLLAQVQAASGGHISYMGFLKSLEKERVLRDAAAVVMPSLCYENFPLAVVEANAWGIPALVSDAGGLREIVVPGINGERYAPGDPADFWAQLNRMMSPERMEGLRRTTQEYARTHFSSTAFLKQRMALYHRLTCTSGGRPL